jgi:acetoin utilization deacetylase AcuC-like enzyme
LTAEDLAERDEFVFRAAEQHSIPVAFTFGGGYNKDISRIVEIHLNTIKKALEVFEK